MVVRHLIGDCVDVLKSLDAESVDCIITSPPYFGLRDYDVGRWEGGDAKCDHIKSTIRRGVNLAASAASTRGGGKKIAEIPSVKYQKRCRKCGARRTGAGIGLEDTLAEHIAALVRVFAECRRVLKPDGNLWVNYGDMYSSAPGGNQGKNSRRAGRTFVARIEVDKTKSGLGRKQLMGAPWRLALAMQDDGWILREDIIWHKPNPAPESVRDRCSRAHEYIFHFSRSERYFFDRAAIAEPASPNTHERVARAVRNANEGSRGANGGSRPDRPMKAMAPNSGVKNNLSFDAAMVEMPAMRGPRSVWTVGSEPFSESHFAVFPTEIPRRCIAAGCPPGGTVLDPFSGAGTTAMVADRLGRNAIAIELNPAYVRMAKRRIAQDRLRRGKGDMAAVAEAGVEPTPLEKLIRTRNEADGEKSGEAGLRIQERNDLEAGG